MKTFRKADSNDADAITNLTRAAYSETQIVFMHKILAANTP